MHRADKKFAGWVGALVRNRSIELHITLLERASDDTLEYVFARKSTHM